MTRNLIIALLVFGFSVASANELPKYLATKEIYQKFDEMIQCGQYQGAAIGGYIYTQKSDDPARWKRRSWGRVGAFVSQFCPEKIWEFGRIQKPELCQP